MCAGMEYLFVFSKTEIPLRGGLAWEQRPAVGNPDDYYSLSAGSGFSVGKGPGKTIVDIAYILTHASDIQGIVPEQSGLHSDVTEHQVFVSCIKRF